MRIPTFFLCALLLATACKKTAPPQPAPTPTSLYFPPIGNTEWQQSNPASLGWNVTALNDLTAYLQSKNTKAFIILKDGKLATETYFGTFTRDSLWYWASAGKTATAFLVGIAQAEGILNLNNPTYQYLGPGWTTTSADKELKITVRHQLTMTTGLDDGVPDVDCTSPQCLEYKADAGTRWAYHNAPYTLLEKVVQNASGKTYNEYFQQKLRDRIGMNGTWIKTADGNNVLFTNARSMARFGMLLLNKGWWDTTPILSDSNYFNSMVNTSQSLNASYGYLTWLNGKGSAMLPGTQLTFQTHLIPNAPADMFAALGKNDQKIYVVPSQKLVVIRMGDAADASNFTLSGFDNELWGRLKTVLKL